MGATWVGPASTIRSCPNLYFTPLSTTFCHVGRILVVDQSRPVPPVPPCPVDEDANYHNFHLRGKTEVSHQVALYLHYRVTVCKYTSIEWGNLYISWIVCFCSVSSKDIVFNWWPSWLGLRKSFGFTAVADSHTSFLTETGRIIICCWNLPL